MRDLASSVGWEVRSAFRELVPLRAVRPALVAIATAFEVLLLAAVIANPAPPPESLRIEVVTGFVGLCSMLAAGAAGLATSTLLARPEGLSLLMLSPIGPRQAVWLALAPATLAALCPIAMLGLPFALAAAQRQPMLALAIAVASACTLAWSVLIAIGLACWAGRQMGRERAARVLRAASGWLAFSGLIGFRSLVRLETGTTALLVFLVATPLAVPPLAARAATALLDLLRDGQPPGQAPAPRWGHAQLGRLLWRSLSLPALVVSLPSVAIVAGSPGLGPPVLGVLVVLLVAAPLDRLLEPEWAAPDRLRLAPAGTAFRVRILVRYGLGSWLLALGTAAFLARGQSSWLAAVGACAALVPLTCFIDARGARIVGQLVLFIAAMAAALLWRR
jgi:hypothetical protein